MDDRDVHLSLRNYCELFKVSRQVTSHFFLYYVNSFTFYLLQFIKRTNNFFIYILFWTIDKLFDFSYKDVISDFLIGDSIKRQVEIASSIYTSDDTICNIGESTEKSDKPRIALHIAQWLFIVIVTDLLLHLQYFIVSF